MASEKVNTLIKVFAIIIGTIGVLTFLSCIYFYVDPTTPKAEITNLSVSNLNTSFPGFTANWAATVKIKNRFFMINAKCDEIKTWVYYEKEFLIASGTLVQPFSLKAGKSKVVHVQLSAKDTDLGKMGKWMVDKMAKDRESNSMVKFRWTIVFPVKRSFLLLKDETSVFVDCQQVRFPLGETDNGQAMNGDLHYCMRNY